jgi:hypothetical protein
LTLAIQNEPPLFLEFGLVNLTLGEPLFKIPSAREVVACTGLFVAPRSPSENPPDY